MSEVEIGGINDVIFSGTGLNYFRDKIKSGVFEYPGGGKVFLTNNVGGAYSAAINRSRSFADEPVILVIDSKLKARGYHLRREGVQKDIVCEQIPKEAIIAAYKVVNIKESDLLFMDDQVGLLRKKGEEVSLD